MMFDFNIEQNENKKILTINGDLTIENAAAFQGVLMSMHKDPGELVLNLEHITGADLSCLQLLYSAYTTFDKSGGCFSLGGNCPVVFREAAREAGYLTDAGCGLHCTTGCIWTNDGNDE